MIENAETYTHKNNKNHILITLNLNLDAFFFLFSRAIEFSETPDHSLQAKDRTQMTALHTAASHGSVGVCKLLLEAGCDLRCFDEEDMTPLHFAAMEGHLGNFHLFRELK